MTTSRPRHAGELLGPYALGALDPAEAQAVENHLASCPRCRAEFADLSAMAGSLGEIPPEAFLDGPPEGGDLLLRRTLRAVRGEYEQSRRRRTYLVAAGVAALAAAALGSGVVVGQHTGGTAALPGSPGASAAPSGTRVLSATDPATGAAMTVSVMPAAGWVRLHATVTGVRAGVKCHILVVPRGGGAAVDAGSWVVSAKGERSGTTLDGSALVAPADVSAVQVTTLDGRTLVSVPV
jgi:predicted anti-sigma-YlaC factor YlaD